MPRLRNCKELVKPDILFHGCVTHDCRPFLSGRVLYLVEELLSCMKLYFALIWIRGALPVLLFLLTRQP